MSETERIDEVDPNESPFEAQPVEGLPFKKGSEEDLAIRRILGKPPPSPSWFRRLLRSIRR